MLVYATDNQLKGLEDRVTKLEEEAEANAPEVGVKYGYLHKILIKDVDNNVYSIYVRMDTRTTFGDVSLSQSTPEERQAWVGNMVLHMIKPICYYEGFQPGEYWGEITPLCNLIFDPCSTGEGYIIQSLKADEYAWTTRFGGVSASDLLVE